jgi:NADPH:quinone reductase-like Zn-dependent oxidoreductase
MATNERDERKAGITAAETTQPDSGDPRDTDHPTGSKQAAGRYIVRIVITGASGNVGTALLRVLPAEHDVVGVVRRPPALQGVYQRAIGARST